MNFVKWGKKSGSTNSNIDTKLISQSVKFQLQLHDYILV